jgi:hypothetical protein
MNTERKSTAVVLLARILIVLVLAGLLMGLTTPLTFGVGFDRQSPVFGDFLTKVAVIAGVVAGVIVFGASRIFLRIVRRKDTLGTRLTLFYVRTVVGAILLTIVAYMAIGAVVVEQSLGALVMVVLLAIGVAALFPTRASLDRWIYGR